MYRAWFFTKIRGVCRRICLLCQQTSLENMYMTSNCDVTNSAHQVQMTTICHWMKPPHENFLRTPLKVFLDECPPTTMSSCLKWPFQSMNRNTRILRLNTVSYIWGGRQKPWKKKAAQPFWYSSRAIEFRPGSIQNNTSQFVPI